MKKVLFYLPAGVYTIAIIALYLMIEAFTTTWFVWTVLLWFSGFLLNKGKIWGGLFGLLPAIHLLYMRTQYTGQVINERPLGIITAAYVLICMFVVWMNRPTKQ